MGLHHSVLPGCTCGTSAPFTYPIQPQKRQWVGLTAAELQAIDESFRLWNSVGLTDYYQAIERALKEKNA
jgi:hypothetical protein